MKIFSGFASTEWSDVSVQSVVSENMRFHSLGFDLGLPFLCGPSLFPYFTGVSVKSLTVTSRLPSLTAKLRAFCPLLREISSGLVCCHNPMV